jgi:hypothetical protein
MNTMELFQGSLTERLLDDPIPSALRSEADLERRFVLPILHDVHQQFPVLHVHAHPWKHAATCQPTCSDGPGLIDGPQVHGCPKCWQSSKSWAAVRLYGLHCFDVIVGKQQDSLVLEIKFLRRAGKGNKKANDGFQHLVGQCTLARLIHPRVIGFCVAETGALDMSATSHVEDLRRQGIRLLVRQN